ncbi:hypothetical protein DP42_4656 [Burkholderia pseudomallei]|nr:hypothetical protein DP42_4656 [Burkholderia pseudomallei]
MTREIFCQLSCCVQNPVVIERAPSSVVHLGHHLFCSATHLSAFKQFANYDLQ